MGIRKFRDQSHNIYLENYNARKMLRNFTSFLRNFFFFFSSIRRRDERPSRKVSATLSSSIVVGANGSDTDTRDGGKGRRDPFNRVSTLLRARTREKRFLPLVFLLQPCLNSSAESADKREGEGAAGRHRAALRGNDFQSPGGQRVGGGAGVADAHNRCTHAWWE